MTIYLVYKWDGEGTAVIGWHRDFGSAYKIAEEGLEKLIAHNNSLNIGCSVKKENTPDSNTPIAFTVTYAETWRFPDEGFWIEKAPEGKYS